MRNERCKRCNVSSVQFRTGNMLYKLPKYAMVHPLSNFIESYSGQLRTQPGVRGGGGFWSWPKEGVRGSAEIRKPAILSKLQKGVHTPPSPLAMPLTQAMLFSKLDGGGISLTCIHYVHYKLQTSVSGYQCSNLIWADFDGCAGSELSRNSFGGDRAPS